MKVLVFVRVEANNAVKIDHKLVYITQKQREKYTNIGLGEKNENS